MIKPYVQQVSHGASRRRLDSTFREGALRTLAPPPAEGWIREIRAAPGMTSRELAHRMGMSQSAVTQLEHSEVTGRAQLESALGRSRQLLIYYRS